MGFQVGHKLGRGAKGRSGRRPRIAEEDLTHALAKEFPAEKVAEVIKRLVDLALGKEMNLAAVQLLLAYRFGKPVEAVRHLGDETAPLVFKLKWPSSVSNSD